MDKLLKKEIEYDVVVVGSGNAALCAAISAKEEDMEVLIVEKGLKEKRGGNSIFTDGAIRCSYENLENVRSIIPNISDNQMENIKLPNYNHRDFYDDLMRVTKNKSDPSLANKLTADSFDTIKWMHQHGVQFELNENQYFKQNGKLVFWGGLPLKTKNKGIGLMNTLFERANQMGIDIIYESKAIQIKQKDETVTGVIIQKNGETEIVATKSVILACGGFEASESKRIEYLGAEWKNAVVRGTQYNTGDGIEMALEVGAKSFGEWNGCHAHTTDYNAPIVGDFEKPGDIYKKSSYPLGLIVNNLGERFVDEGADFRNYTYAKYGKETLKQPNQKAFQLYDSQVYSLLRKEYKIEEATCIRANSIDELAQNMGVNPKNLKKTISEYNNSVQTGNYNPSIKDGKGTKGINPPKSNWALKYEKDPFYAYPVTCGITFTFGGIHVNDKSEVLDNKDRPIKGLFAAGEMVGGLFYHNYPGGSGLMSGAVFGKQAGKTAAKYIK